MKRSEVDISLKHDVMALTSQIWGQLGRCNGIRVQPYALETAYQWLKHFVYCICLLWMHEAIWGGYQPQTWSCGIISTPQVNLTSQIQRQKKARPTFRVKTDLGAFANFSLALTFIDSHFINSNFMNFILKKNPNFELSQLFNVDHTKIQLCWLFVSFGKRISTLPTLNRPNFWILTINQTLTFGTFSHKMLFWLQDSAIPYP